MCVSVRCCFLFVLFLWPAFVTPQENIPPGAATLAFVFDITGSMYDDLVQVIDGAAKIMATTLARIEKPLYNYVLVPFHDPDVGPIVITKDPDEFQSELRKLYVQGGGDCPEMSVRAIKEALDVSLPNSYIYVFTDALSKDFYLGEEVLALIQQKQSQVVFVLTGDCGKPQSPGYKVYERIASTSSGQVFLLKKKQVNQVLDFVRLTVQARKVNLMSVDLNQGNSQFIQIPIDSKLQEFTVSLSGASPELRLYNPNGAEVLVNNGLRELLSIKSVKVINVRDPKPGAWRLRVDSSSAHTLRITGLSKMDFAAGFDQQKPAHISSTQLRPLEGVRSHILVNTTDLDRPGQLQRLQLVSLNGITLSEYPLVGDVNEDNIYRTDAFKPPSGYFYIKVIGEDDQGHELWRTTPTAISPRKPAPPTVYMPEITRGFYHSTATIVCVVESVIPFTVQWYKNGLREGSEVLFQESGNATYQISRASSSNEGIYTCNATSPSGSTARTTLLDISEPPPEIAPTVNVSVLPGSSALLTCQVYSTAPYNVTWYGPQGQVKPQRQLVNFNNGSLLIRYVELGHEGQYVCRVGNEGGYSQEKVFLRVQVPPVVYIKPSEQTFKVGDSVTLTCYADGFPLPSYYWLRNGALVIPNSRISVNHNQLAFSNMEQSDEGAYSCLAENLAGDDTAIATLQYIERPQITVFEKKVIVGSGDMATLHCSAKGIPVPEIHWFKGELELKQLSYVKISDDGDLSIIGAQEQDQGEYMCIATNTAGSDSVLIDLEVGADPRITKAPFNMGADITTNASLPCEAIGDPTPKIYWLFKGSPIKTGGRFNQDKAGNLFIYSLEYGNEGRYTCVAQNQFGVQEASAFLSITGIVSPVIAYTNPYLDVVEGSDVALSCVVVQGNPTPTVHWQKGSKVLENSDHVTISNPGEVTIHKIQKLEQGDYVCVASNVGGNSTYLVSINVQVPPHHTFYKEEDERSNFTVVEGGGIILPCNVEGDPRPTISWYKDGSPISLTDYHYFIREDGSLEIFSADPDDTAEYKCTASNEAGEIHKTVQLFVQAPPVIQGEETQQLTVNVGQTILLPCSVKGKPTPEVHWRKNFVQFLPESSERFLFSDVGLTIYNTEISDRAIYECVASNVAGETTKIITLIVQIPPTISSEGESNIVVVKGEAAFLNCDTLGDPDPEVTWKKDDVILDPTSDLDITMTPFGSLEFSKVEVADDGRYVCIATNPAGSAVKDFILIVQDPPFFPPFITNHTQVIENNPVTIPCPAVGTPPPLITWYKDDVLLTGDEAGVTFLDDGSLELYNVDAKDTADYRCVATNAAGEVEHTVALHVLIPPKLIGKDNSLIDRNPTNTHVVVNHTASFFCPIEGDPTPVVTWKRNGEDLFGDGERIFIWDEGRNLTIAYADVSDTARYTCVATNKAGETDKSFNLEVQVPPVLDYETVTPSNLSVVIGNTLFISCPMSGIPPPKITWYKNGEFISPELDPNIRIFAAGRRLELMSARVTDLGLYRCEGVNSAGTNDNEYEVEVHVPPSIVREGVIEHPEVIVRRSINLTCPASGIPRPQISWFKANKIIKENATNYVLLEGGWTLYILNASEEDSSRFTCRAKNIAGNNEKAFDLQVLVPAHIQRENINTEPRVILNRTLVLNCPVGGTPTPDIFWYKEGILLDLSHRIDVLSEGRQLRVPNSQLTDSGTYTCEASNKAGIDRQDYNVQIQVPSKIDEFRTNVKPRTIINSPLTIACPASGIPPPVITWYKDGNVVDFSKDENIQLDKDGQELTIKVTEVKHTGTYSCEAANEAGTAKLDFDVFVEVPPSISQTEKSPKVKVGEETILHCPASGTPEPEIVWLKNGQPIDFSLTSGLREQAGGKELHIHNAVVDYGGVYTCVASNSAGDDQVEIELEVWVPPTIDKDNFEKYTGVIRGRTTVLNCPALGLPPPNILWFKDGSPLVLDSRMELMTGGLQLKIVNTTIEDTGTFKCRAVNPAGEDSVEMDLEVMVPPSIDESNVVYTPKVVQNRTVIIECPVSGVPEPTVTWSINDSPLTPRDRVQLLDNNRQLTIDQAQVADTAVYMCVASNKAGELRKKFQLEVLVPAYILTEVASETELVTIQNQTININCPSMGIPPPSILWLKNRVPLLDNPYKNMRVVNNNQVLEISNAQVQDAGKYLCTVTNAAGQEKREFNLQVHVPPFIAESQGEEVHVAVEGGAVTMECHVGGVPEPLVTWLKDGQILQTEENAHVRILSGGQIFQILVVKTTDAAKYTCQAENMAGLTEKYYRVEVQVPPRINGSQFIQKSVVINQQLYLTCEASGNPPPKIVWQRQYQAIPPYGNPSVRIRDQGRQLLLTNAQLLDEGEYTCLATNPAGNASVDFSVSVQVPPSIEDGPKQVVGIVNTRVDLACNSIGLPVPEVKWEKNNQVFPTTGLRHRMLVGGSLEFTAVRLEDAGTYVCTASNDAGSVSREITLDVQVPPKILGDTQRSMQAVLGDDIHLPCSVEGDPPPTIIWQKGTSILSSGADHYIMENGTLLLRRTDERDSGMYICIARNNAGTAMAQIFLRMFIPPRITDVTQTQYSIQQGRNIVLPCRAEGRPQPQIAWEKDGEELTGSYHYRLLRSGWLLIPYSRPDDTGTYRCTATNTAGQDQVTMTLTVHMPPRIEEGPRLMTGTVGSTARIPCNTTGEPRPEITWLKDGRLIREAGKYIVEDSGTLVINSLDADDTGSYTCTAINVAGRDSMDRVLRVQVPPKIIQAPRSQEVIQNSRIVLSCAATGIPVPTVTWTLNGKPVPAFPSINGRSFLHIHHALRQDAGMYTCIAENPAGIATASTPILMKVPPQVSVPESDATVSVADQVMLTCSVGGDPNPDIRWTKNGRPVELSERIVQLLNGSLVIYDSTSSDAGEYKCVASNDAGTSEGVAMLTVQEPPSFRIEPTNRRVVQGSTVVMDCVAEGEPAPDISWLRGWRDIVTGERISVLHNNSLRILAVQLSDGGLYRCKAANRLGITIVEANMTIVVHGRFSEWTSWGLCSNTCGVGLQFRTRECDSPPPQNGGRQCIGSSLDSKTCVSGHCPVDGDWGNWLPWKPCSMTCGVGQRSRERLCDNPAPLHGGSPCPGPSVAHDICNEGPCPVDGSWSGWGSWGACSVSCGEGVHERQRACDNPPSQFGGQYCLGDNTQLKMCSVQQCAVDGMWGQWNHWTACSQSCGGGVRTRTRSCDSPAPLYGGSPCSGRGSLIDYCNPQPCPVHGNWAGWESWGACSVSCGVGLMKRFRTCSNPAPSISGRPCIGAGEEGQRCTQQLCPVDAEWGVWGAWSTCSQTCGVGHRERSRTCSTPQNGGRYCAGDEVQRDLCSLTPCSRLPRKAFGTLVGYINGVDLTDSTINAVMTTTDDGENVRVEATIKDLPPLTGRHIEHLVSVLAPVYWVTASEKGGAKNGFSLSDGKFSRDVQVEYATGEIVKMSQYASGVDEEGVLQIDVIVRGEVPDLSNGMELTLTPYYENYIQTGQGTIFARSSRTIGLDGHLMPYMWNHSISYETTEIMPFLVETLHTRDISSSVSATGDQVEFSLLTSITPGTPSNQCPSGFHLDGSGLFCQDDDECWPVNPCSHHCHNSPGKFACSCPPGYILGVDSRTCEDLDECRWNNGGCGPEKECLNTEGSFHCATVCKTGYRRNQDMFCIDIDECTEDPLVCGQYCKNTAGSYQCSCSLGFKLKSNGRCTDVNECTEGGSTCSHICRNQIGSYRCACPSGYRLISNVTCQDVDECKEEIHKCTEEQECQNIAGSYQCVQKCSEGYQEMNGQCVDVDECTLGTHQCYSNQRCVNSPGGYSCQCETGFRTAGIRHPCLDIDECKENPNVCIYRCHNTQGSFVCVCPLGQILLADKRSCAGLEYLEPEPDQNLLKPASYQKQIPSVRDVGKGCQYPSKCFTRSKRSLCEPGFQYNVSTNACVDVNECEEDPQICQHNCSNTVGSYHCTCPPGYKLGRNDRNCVDINECITSNIECGPEKMCFNKRGDVSCIEIPCPENYTRDPLTKYCVLECIDSSLCPEGAKYADVIEFRTLALPSGILPHQDLIRLTVFNQNNVKMVKTDFVILENDSKVTFALRPHEGTGILFTEQPLEELETYRIKVRAQSYSVQSAVLQYQTTFMIHISISAYPY
uniref:Cell adhesion molecule-related/down-regulated by oncogenes n=1 Tax=Crassostrea virginica TaxID=6565 RepID=A0A8B8D266_CRAVI|nr:hemicentin-1-like isoform X1 [Crassostrea virginica]